jgi:hypothetical protein
MSMIELSFFTPCHDIPVPVQYASYYYSEYSSSTSTYPVPVYDGQQGHFYWHCMKITQRPLYVKATLWRWLISILWHWQVHDHNYSHFYDSTVINAWRRLNYILGQWQVHDHNCTKNSHLFNIVKCMIITAAIFMTVTTTGDVHDDDCAPFQDNDKRINITAQ